MVIDDPVHQLETAECDGEEDAAVLVDVRGGDAEHGVDVPWGEEGDGGWGGGRYGHLINTLVVLTSEKK